MTSKLAQEKQLLLEQYEPILFFAPGERFFPMDVEKYFKSCQLYPPMSDKFLLRMEDKLRRKRKPKDCTEDDDCLQNTCRDNYFHFVHEYKLQSAIERIFVLFSLIILFGIIWYSIQPTQFGLLRKLSPRWPEFWSGYDNFRMAIIYLFILVGAFKQVNRIVHIAFVQCIIMIIFFGTSAGTAFSIFAGMLALSYAITYWILGKNPNNNFQLFRKYIFIVLILFLLDVLLVKFFDKWFGFEKEMMGQFFSWIDYYSYLLITLIVWAQLTIFIILPSLLILIDKALLVSIKFIKANTNKLAYSKLIKESEDYRQHLTTTLLLLINTIFIVIVFYQINRVNWVGHDKIIAHALIVTTVTVIIFSFFANPNTFFEYVRQTSSKSEVQPSGRRMSSISVVWFLIYMPLSFNIALRSMISVSIQNQIIIFIIIGLIVLGSVFITIGLLGTSVAGYLLDWQSSQPDITATQAKFKYDLFRDGKLFPYYGRVTTKNSWLILQYHYFYAFNDWRSGQGGLNQHEGDWECVNIYLKVKQGKQNNYESENYEDIGVACSQHHNGKFSFWEDVELKNISHPCIYVGKGSHANFFKPKSHPISMFMSGITREILTKFDGIIRIFRGQYDGLPREFTSKYGCNIGNSKNKWQLDSLSSRVAIKNYQGLWGKKEMHKDESGPTGPMWDRYDKHKNKEEQPIRLRWGEKKGGLEWLETLLLEQTLDESKPIEKRKRALQALINIE